MSGAPVGDLILAASRMLDVNGGGWWEEVE